MGKGFREGVEVDWSFSRSFFGGKKIGEDRGAWVPAGELLFSQRTSGVAQRVGREGWEEVV